MIRDGQGIERGLYERAARAQAAFREQMAETMTSAGIDLWLTPAATGPAPRGLESTGNSDTCLPWSFAGFPSEAVPATLSAAGLPLGVQCVGLPGRDEQVLGWALPVEAAFQTSK